MKVGNESKYVPAPEGVFEAVCVDVVDLGIVPGAFGPKHKLKIAWEIEEKMEDGRPFIVSQRYTATLNKQSNLFAHLTSWRGKQFTPEELKEFELDNVLGAPCMLVIKHNIHDGNVYANVSDVLKSKNPIKATGKYTRAKDRKDYKEPSSTPAASAPGWVPEEGDDNPDLSPKKEGAPF